MDPWISLLDELMQEAPEFPSEEIETRVAASMLIAIMLRKPNHPDGARWAERALELARKQKDPFLKATITVNWSGYYWQLGNIPKASLVIDEMRSLMRDRDVSPSVAMTAGIGVVWHEALAALPSYKRTVSEMLEQSHRTGFEAAKYNALMAGIIGALSDGDLETGDPWLRELLKNFEVRSHGFTFFAYWAIVWTALIRNDFSRAASNQPEMLRLGISDGWSVNNLVAYLMSAHVLAMQGKEEETRIHLQQALEIARITHSPYFEFIARLTEAQLCFHKGQEADGMRALKIAMMLGRHGGFINSPVWIPALMTKLCAKALEANIEVEYVQGLIRKRKLVPKEAPSEIEAWPWPVKIYTLGRFKVLKDDQPLQFAGKVQRKPLALLKAMIAFGGRHVREELLIDALWPDADGDAARFALTSALHRLRKLLGHEEAIIRKDNEIGLDDRYCWIDTWAAERLVARSETASRGNGEERSWQQATELIQRAVALYRGSFLSNDPEATWGMTLADRLRRRLLRQLKLIGERHEEKEQLQQAADLYEEALRVDICAEDVCRRLMILYHQLGRPSEVASIYRQCREALNSQYGINLSAETEELLKTLRSSFGSQAAVGK
jgi:LuxR family transcriptional regulator, maltose regulon positive regulatory protein